ncbi:MAG: GNAT family N-acetyltransferase [bacterium]|nr:GNAT family N-acetyltransferase [bacterium]
MTTRQTGAYAERLASALENEAPSQVKEVLSHAALAGEAEIEAIDAQLVRRLRDPRLGATLSERLSLPVYIDLVGRCTARLDSSLDINPKNLQHKRETAWALLDVVRRSSFLRRVAEEGQESKWAQRILELIECSDFTFPHLLAQRSSTYGNRPLLLYPQRGRTVSLSYSQVQGRVDLIAKGLRALMRNHPSKRVAILSQNIPEYALVDLACLASGIVDVMIPATASTDDIGYILRHSDVGVVFVSDPRGLRRVIAASDGLDPSPQIITLDRLLPRQSRGLTYEQLLDQGARQPDEPLAEKRSQLKIDDLATIMYTSGTTGIPKGICFSHRNIVFKRFARALALPEIGPNDRFLCYLPLFHTFGRFFELTGSIFWGASYCFAEDTSITTLTHQMKHLQPSVFISIPRKWIQLFEAITNRIDIDTASDLDIRSQVNDVTGGRLRWGLSAAGYLNPEIFRFFNRNGVSLMSGFGMTEATGGITMTPPDNYTENSLGSPLPGIEAKLAPDGELLVRGSYVMMGYLDPPNGESAFDENGWLATGDIMETDAEGYFRIIDRKKEIYKNVKGETIAPQKIENLFRDFDSVGRVFLAGDHREYNTALIFPNLDYEGLDFRSLDPEELKDHFRSIVVSVNTFLEPFERIVDFAILDRDFDAEHGELTPKGTFRRGTIENNYSDQIALLYQRSRFSIDGVEITFPNWLYQALGITIHDLEIHDSKMVLPETGRSLSVKRGHDSRVQIGSCIYRTPKAHLDLGVFLATPRLWVGNEELSDFVDLAPRHRSRQRRHIESYKWDERPIASQPNAQQKTKAKELIDGAEVTLSRLHASAVLSEAEDPSLAQIGVNALERTVATTDGAEGDIARHLLRRLARSRHSVVACLALKVLITSEMPGHYQQTLRTFLDSPACNLIDESISDLFAETLSPERLDAIIAETGALCRRAKSSPQQENVAERFLSLLVGYGTDHPSQYQRLRSFLTRMASEAESAPLRSHAENSVELLTEGFRSWLGSPARVAVDPETGREYGWADVIEFAEDVDDIGQERLREAIRMTPLLAEGVFLFSKGKSLHLSDIPPGGIWIRLLGRAYGKSVYRVAIRTRFGEQVDLAVNLGEELSSESMDDETRWLIACSDPRNAKPLVEEFGGYWRKRKLWTEEYIPGESLDRALRVASRRDPSYETLTLLWPAAAWSAAAVYIGFWDRTGRQLAIADPGPANVIAPMHDYQTGARIISIAKREPCDQLSTLLLLLKHKLVAPVEAEHEPLLGIASWRILFSALLEAIGESDGLVLLRRLLEDLQKRSDDSDGTVDSKALRAFIQNVERKGFLPRRLHFSIQRYRRWQFLNRDATLAARAATLKELGTTYGLVNLNPDHPETRVRFYRDTVFHETINELAEGLEFVITQLREHGIVADEIPQAIADLRARIHLDRDQDFFLARLTYPYLRPEDDVEFVARDVGSERLSEMVVGSQDHDGNLFFVRHALTAKEIGRLYDLFVEGKLKVQFRTEHKFLVAVSERGTVIGGLFYEVDSEEQVAHLEKIVIDSRFKSRGIARALMDELCHRLATQGLRSLTTGFFRPQFFYHFGFTVERRYAGLVRTLAPPDEET